VEREEWEGDNRREGVVKEKEGRRVSKGEE